MSENRNQKLDDEVAEKLFGWKWSTFLGTHYLLRPDQYEDGKPEEGYLGWTAGKAKGSKRGFVESSFVDSRYPCRYQSVPEFSGRISEAFRVMSVMTSNNEGTEFPKALCFDLFCDGDGDWMCKFGLPGKPREWFDAENIGELAPWVGTSGHTAAEAICRAALAFIKCEGK